jgi:hypothetical protein
LLSSKAPFDYNEHHREMHERVGDWILIDPTDRRPFGASAGDTREPVI